MYLLPIITSIDQAYEELEKLRDKMSTTALMYSLKISNLEEENKELKAKLADKEKGIPTIGELLDHYAKHPLDMDSTDYTFTIYKHKTDKYPDRFSVTANSLSEATKKINDHLKALFNLTLDNCYCVFYSDGNNNDKMFVR